MDILDIRQLPSSYRTISCTESVERTILMRDKQRQLELRLWTSSWLCHKNRVEMTLMVCFLNVRRASLKIFRLDRILDASTDIHGLSNKNSSHQRHSVSYIMSVLQRQFSFLLCYRKSYRIHPHTQRFLLLQCGISEECEWNLFQCPIPHCGSENLSILYTVNITVNYKVPAKNNFFLVIHEFPRDRAKFCSSLCAH